MTPRLWLWPTPSHPASPLPPGPLLYSQVCHPAMHDARPWPLDVCAARPKKRSDKLLVFNKIGTRIQRRSERSAPRQVGVTALPAGERIQAMRSKAEAGTDSLGSLFHVFCQRSAGSSRLSPRGGCSVCCVSQRCRRGLRGFVHRLRVTSRRPALCHVAQRGLSTRLNGRKEPGFW